MNSRNHQGALTPEDFAPRDRSEQRREERHMHRRTIQILPILQMGTPSFTEAELVDCSRHGMGLISTAPLRPGDEFLVRFNARKIVLLLYAVRYCAEENGRFHIGAEFADLSAGPFENNPQKVLDALLTPEPATDAGAGAAG
jgi:hypothetical protein